MGTYPLPPPLFTRDEAGDLQRMGIHVAAKYVDNRRMLFTGDEADQLARMGIRPPAGLVDYTPRPPRPPGKWRLRWRQLKARIRGA